MAGKKQHYIPKALLKGFRATQAGQYGQAVVYKSTGNPYLSSIADIAVERYFYSDVDASKKTLDDKITDYENRLADLLRNLQGTEEGHSADSLVAAEVVAHLSVRGAYLRETFSSGVRQLMQGASASFGDPDKARAWLGADDHDGNSLLIESIDGEIDRLKESLPAGLPIPLFRRFLLHFVRENFDNLYREIFPAMGAALRQLASNIPAVIRNSHAKVLETGIVPDKRVSDLAGLSWSVFRSKQALVLPDCAAVSVERNAGTMQPYMLGSLDNITAILLPISANQVLVGRPPGAAVDFNESDFNSQAASCCSTFFVASELTDELRAIAANIGKVTHAAIGALVAESLGKFGVSAASAADISVLGRAPQSGLTSYRVDFRNCATQEEAEVIAKVVGVITNGLAPHLELHHLAAIIFAEDYEAALRDLDVETGVSVRLETTNVEGLVGIGTNVTVMQEGEPRAYIVMRAGIGRALISEVETERRAAAHALSTMLSQVAFTSLLEAAFGPPEVQPSLSPWDSLLYGPMRGALTGYYSAWVSAEVDPTAANTYREVVLTMLDHANRLIDKERTLYATHADLDRFLVLTTGALGEFLVSVAKLVGHCDANNESIYGEDASLKDAFNQHGLCDWVALYAKDLRRAFSSRGEWKSTKELTSLGVHMERQLWRHFVFPWVMDDGRVRVEVPYMGNAGS